ncbi:MAG: hypothetical protein V1688_01770, partial [bacterium]
VGVENYKVENLFYYELLKYELFFSKIIFLKSRQEQDGLKCAMRDFFLAHFNNYCSGRISDFTKFGMAVFLRNKNKALGLQDFED